MTDGRSERRISTTAVLAQAVTDASRAALSLTKGVAVAPRSARQDREAQARSPPISGCLYILSLAPNTNSLLSVHSTQKAARPVMTHRPCWIPKT